MRDTERAVSTTIARTWEQGLATGNGIVGAMLFGPPGAETVVINRAGLFLPTVRPIDPPHLAPRLPELRRLIAARRFREAAVLAVEQGLCDRS